MFKEDESKDALQYVEVVPARPKKGFPGPLPTGPAQLSIRKCIASSLQVAVNKCVNKAVFRVAEGRDISHVVADEIAIL